MSFLSPDAVLTVTVAVVSSSLYTVILLPLTLTFNASDDELALITSLEFSGSNVTSSIVLTPANTKQSVALIDVTFVIVGTVLIASLIIFIAYS